MTASKAPGADFNEAAVEADGFRIRYYEAGAGDPLVVLHGGGGPNFTYALDGLAERFRVILVEMPGFGDEVNDRTQTLADMAGTIDTFAGALGLDSYNLMGTSFGGAVATHVALGYPERLTALVLEAPAVFREGGVEPGPGMDPAELLRGFRTHPEREPVMRPPDPAKMMQVWPLVERLVSRTPEYDEELVARLSKCTVRTLVVFGEDDTIVPPKNGRTFRRAMPDCSFVVVNSGAHDLQSDRPEAFAAVVGDFLTQAWSVQLPEGSSLINP